MAAGGDDFSISFMCVRALPAAQYSNPLLPLLLITSLCALACNHSVHEAGLANTAKPDSSAAVAAKPTSRLAFLREGQLWTINEDGAEAKAIAPAQGEMITEFIWSEDGERLLYISGTQVLSTALENGQTSTVGALNLPPEIVIDRMERSREPQMIIIQTTDEIGQIRLYSFSLERGETFELTVDDYNRLSLPQPPVIRQMTDLSVSPDATRMLYKRVVDLNEELFVGEVETGAREQLTETGALEGFEESAILDGTRRIIEAAWSPDGRYVIFNPAQSCSEAGFCYGRLYLVDAWSRAKQRRLTEEMMVGVVVDWAPDGERLAFEEAGQIMIADVDGNVRRLVEGSRPRWQPGKKR